MGQVAVKMKRLSAGPFGVRRKGEVCVLDAAEAQALLDGGYAEKAILAPFQVPKAAPAENQAAAPEEAAAEEEPAAKPKKR